MIREISGGMVSTLAGQADKPGCVDGPALASKFAKPRDVAMGSGGVIYVADSDNNCIRKIENGTVSTFAGACQTGLASPCGSKNGSTSTATFCSPGGVDLDNAGAILVADTDNHSIRKISGGVVDTLTGTGVAGFADGPHASAQFNKPEHLAVGSAGKIYVVDRGNQRIRVIVP
jgi:DNA-binding beta-propeller fold protein YncE